MTLRQRLGVDTGDNTLYLVALFLPTGIFNLDQFFVETERNEHIDRLAIDTVGKLLTGDAVGKTGDIDYALVDVQELRLPSGCVFGLDDQRGQAGSQAGANDHHIPARQVTEVDVSVQFGDFGSLPYSGSTVLRGTGKRTMNPWYRS